MGDIYRDPQRRAATAHILADVDNFKSFNDTFGHAIGDTVLRTVAETIRATLPPNAFPARTGGEEFA
ncbi:MAG: GGDEF domain-containing protein, partial [Hoeflea sp.]|nr:GGDEF domain-containing protein [Hoeflea sp.]